MRTINAIPGWPVPPVGSTSGGAAHVLKDKPAPRLGRSGLEPRFVCSSGGVAKDPGPGGPDLGADAA